MTVELCDINSLKVGDRLSRISYMNIIEDQGDAVVVENEQGFSWRVGKGILQQEAYTANQYTSTEEKTASELADILEHAGDSIFTVEFTKQPARRDVSASLEDLSGWDFSKKTQRDKFAREALTGEDRAMIGYLVTTEPKMGRSQVMDLEAKGMRLVDHRTIKAITLRNTRYTLKK